MNQWRGPLEEYIVEDLDGIGPCSSCSYTKIHGQAMRISPLFRAPCRRQVVKKLTMKKAYEVTVETHKAGKATVTQAWKSKASFDMPGRSSVLSFLVPEHDALGHRQ